MREVLVEELYTVQNVVQRTHVDRVQVVVDRWIAQRRPLFPLRGVTGPGSAGLLVDLTDGGDLMIIDGVHRCLAAMNRGRCELFATVLSSPHPLPPPGPLVNLLDVEVSARPTDLEPVRERLDANLFRPGAQIAADLEGTFALQ